MSKDNDTGVRVGEILADRFEVGDPLGQGGMAVVHLGHDMRLHRDVAIKVLRADTPSRMRVRERLFREAGTIAQLVHPHIVSVYDVGEFEDAVYVVMELLVGASVGDLLADGEPFETVQALEIGCQMASALEAAHHIGVVHRDVKPDNMFLIDSITTGTLAKLLDFSLASVDEPKDGLELTMVGAVFGTPAYMAPEQAKGEKAVPATDLYGLGASLFEMFSGYPPFDADTAVGMLQAHINEPAPWLAEQVDSLPLGLSELVAELLSKEPADRPASAGEVRRRMQSMLESTIERKLRTWGSVAPRQKTRAYNAAAAVALAADSARQAGDSGNADAPDATKKGIPRP